MFFKNQKIVINELNFENIFNTVITDIKYLIDLEIIQKKYIIEALANEESLNIHLNKIDKNLLFLNSLVNDLNNPYPYSINLRSFININSKKIFEIKEYTKEIRTILNTYILDSNLEQTNTTFQADKTVSKVDDIINNIPPENTLLISESKNIVYLPYESNNIEFLLKKEPNLSKLQIIKKYFTKSFSYYKNPFVARFKEAFSLMRNKQHSSVFDALSLAFELLFNYNLHPAVISACQNLDELDIYLDYLENGNTDKFKCFNIIFDIPPIVTKNKK